jgi:hypothetical protein
MKILKGKYRLQSRSLNFDVVNDLDFNNSNCFYFRGDNGFGKTSFLEKIIIPALKAHNLPYLYVGQDIRTQFYTLRAFLSIQGLKVSDMDEVELLRLWVNHGQPASVLILDEFDKYFPDYGFIFDWSKAFIRTYIIVTHLGMYRCAAVADRYRICDVRFELINIEDRLKNVRVRHE